MGRKLLFLSVLALALIAMGCGETDDSSKTTDAKIRLCAYTEWGGGKAEERPVDFLLIVEEGASFRIFASDENDQSLDLTSLSEEARASLDRATRLQLWSDPTGLVPFDLSDRSPQHPRRNAMIKVVDAWAGPSFRLIEISPRPTGSERVVNWTAPFSSGIPMDSSELEESLRSVISCRQANEQDWGPIPQSALFERRELLDWIETRVDPAEPAESEVFDQNARYFRVRPGRRHRIETDHQSQTPSIIPALAPGELACAFLDSADSRQLRVRVPKGMDELVEAYQADGGCSCCGGGWQDRQRRHADSNGYLRLTVRKDAPLIITTSKKIKDATHIQCDLIDLAKTDSDVVRITQRPKAQRSLEVNAHLDFPKASRLDVWVKIAVPDHSRLGSLDHWFSMEPPPRRLKIWLEPEVHAQVEVKLRETSGRVVLASSMTLREDFPGGPAANSWVRRGR